MVPKNLIKLEGKQAAAMLRLNEALEEHDDVQSVYSNFDIDEKELESLSAVTCAILGIDCGSARTGYGVIESDGRDHRMLVVGSDLHQYPSGRSRSGCWKSPAELRRVMREHRPEFAAVEEVFHAVNAKTALKLAHVRGVALLAIAEAGVQLAEYSPLEVKINVVGYGRAEKCQVQLMVQSLLRLPEAIASEDAADALAVAICHATHEATSRKLA